MIDGPRLTRRAMLEGAAAIGAASLVAPSAALGDRERVFSRFVGSLPAGVSPSIKAPGRFSLVGVEWEGPADATIELRTGSRWSIASVLGHGPDRSEQTALFGEPIWTGPADYVQLRSSSAIHGVRLHFGRVTATAPARAAAGVPLAQPVLRAGPGQPPIIARSAWARGQARPSKGPFYGAVRLAFVHHSETPNGYSAAQVPSILLGIFDYHRYVRGYNDIAYNFAIDSYGRIWEARKGGIDLPVLGAHAGGYNAESTGVVVLGSFMNLAPSAAAIAALERLLAWKLSLHGLPVLGRVTVTVDPASAFYTPFRPGAHVSLPRISGHRDGDSTDCPGNAFYARLPSIRPRVASLAGSPASLTIALPRTSTPPQLTGRLMRRGRGPIAGAPIELQTIGARGVTTVATATTDANGSWAATFVPTRKQTLLRALHRPAPAAVSPVLELAIRRR